MHEVDSATDLFIRVSKNMSDTAQIPSARY